MDIWEKLLNEAKKQYHPEELSPFISAYHVACALEAENGEIYTGFCIEGASGVIALCAERTAALNMILSSGQKVVKRLVCYIDGVPDGTGGWTPCGACREFFMQLSDKNKDMEILIDFNTKKTIKLIDLINDWWGWKRY
ncbi:MAG: cytidine deaminase [Clostridiales bacterium]|nr:cytidine deaminase [Clostridiales bacterium]